MPGGVVVFFSVMLRVYGYWRTELAGKEFLAYIEIGAVEAVWSSCAPVGGVIGLAVVDGCQFHFSVTRVVRSCRGLYHTMSVCCVRCSLVYLVGREVVVMTDREGTRESRVSGGEPQVCSEAVASVDLQCGIEVCCFGLVGAPASFV